MNGRITVSGSRQRRQVGAIIAVMVIVLGVLVFGFWFPIRERGEHVRTRIRDVERELVAYRHEHCRPPLELQCEAALRSQTLLQGQWEQLRARVDTFKGASPLTAGLSADEEGRIDFKVALFNARTMLSVKAAAKSIELPSDLGIDENIGTDEQAETRLWQLASITRLLETAITIGIPRVEHIEPLAPVTHPLTKEENALCKEFPIRLDTACTFDQLNALVDALLEEGRFFALRRFRAERVSRSDADPLEVSTVYGSFLFQVRRAGDAVISPEGNLPPGGRAPRPRGPGGGRP